MTTPTLELNIRATGIAEVNALRQGLAGLRSEADKLKALSGGFGALDEAVKQLKELRKEIGKGFSGLEASLRTSMQGAARVAKEGGAATAKAFEEALAKGIRDRQSQNEKMAASVTAINAAVTEKAKQSGQAVGRAYAEGVEQAASKVRLSGSVSLGNGVRASLSQSGFSGYSSLLNDLGKAAAFGPAAAASQAKAVAELEKQVERVMRAATQGPNTMRGGGYIKWWEQVLADRAKAEAAIAAADAKAISMLDKQVAGVMRAALQGPNTMRGKGYIKWWEEVLADRAKAEAAIAAADAKAIALLDKQVEAVMRAALQGPNTMRGKGYIKWWEQVLADRAKAEAAIAAADAKAIAMLDKQVEAVMRAALQGPNTMRGKGYTKWWEKAIAEQDRGIAELRARTAAGMVMMDQEVSRFRKNQMSDLSRTARGQMGSALAEAGWYSTLSGTQKNVPEDGGASKLSRLSQALSVFTGRAGDAHSAARGLASGFGLLWLTWGNMLPLLAGAAISNGFVQIIKLGAEVQNTFTMLRALAGESAESVGALNTQMLELARNSQFKPTEITATMKMLALAGLDAKAVYSAVNDVLNFAVAGDTTLEKAADVMTTVATAFRVSADNYAYVGDTISVAAAESKSSVESMGEAFKTASVINSQYGVSLEDTAVGLSLLANAGIQGTAAGTAIKNMYADLAGRTPKVEKALKELGVNAIDPLTGRMRAQEAVFRDLMKSLADYTPSSQSKALRTIFSERGEKEAMQILRALTKTAEEQATDVGSAYDRLAEKVRDAAGFTTMAAAEMALTPLNQMKSVSAGLQASLVETFNLLQPYVIAMSAQLKEAFASSDFKGALASVALAVASFTTFLIEHARVIATVVAGYVALRAALGITGAVAAAVVAFGSLTAAITAGVTSVGLATRAVAVFNPVLTALATLVTLAAAGWATYTLWANKGKEATDNAGQGDGAKALLARLEAEEERLLRINEARGKGISLMELEAQLAVEQSRGATTEINKARSALSAFDKENPNLVSESSKMMTYAQARKLRERTVLASAVSRAETAHGEDVLKAQAAADRIKSLRQTETERMREEQEKQAKSIPKGLKEFAAATAKTKGGASHNLAYDNDAEMLRSQFRTRESELKAGYDAERLVLENAQRNKLLDEGTFQARALLQLENHEAQVRAAVAQSREELTQEYNSRVSAAALLPTIDDQVNAEANLTSKYRTAIGELDAAMTKLNADAGKRIGLMTQNAAGAVLALKAENEEYWAKLAAGVDKESEAAQARAALADASEDVRARRAAEIKVEEQAAPQIEKLRKEYEKAADALEKFGSEYGDGATVESLALYAGLEQRLQGIGSAIAYANAQLEKTKQSAGDGAIAEIQAKNDERRRKEIRSMADDLNEAFAEALLEGGKDGGQKLHRWLKDLFKQPITLVLKSLFQPFANAAASFMSESLGLGGLGGSGGAGGALQNWGVGQVLGKAKDWALSAFGFNTGAASAALAGSNVATGVAVTGDLASSIAAANAASAAGSAGGLMSTIGPALPWVGVGLMVARLFSKKGGGPKVQGYSSNYFVGGDNDLETNKSMQSTMDELAGRYGTLNRLFGGRGGIGFGMGVSMDPKGDANTFVGARLTKDGQTLQDWTNSNVPRTEAEMQKVIADYTTTQLFIGLVNSGLEKKYQDYFDKVAASLQPGDEGVKAMQAAIELATAVKQLSDQLKPLGGIFTGISDLSMEATKELIDFAGGVDALASSLSSYYQNFYSEEERFAASLSSVQKTMTDLGYGSVDTLAEFRNLVNGLDLTTAEGRQLFTQLMGVQQAFHDVYDSAARLEKLKGLTDEAMARLERSVGKQVTALERQRDALQGLEDELQGIFDLLKDSIQGLYDEVPSVVSFKAAQGDNFIAQALAAARLTGSLPNEEELSDAIKDSRKGLDEAVFASQADADYARLVLAGRLSELKDIAGLQLTDAQKQLKATEDQLASLESILDTAREQIAVMREGAYSVVQALNMLAAALAAERAATPGRPGGTAPSNSSVVEGLYNGMLGRSSDPEGLVYWTNRLASGESLDSVKSAMQASAEYVNRVNGGLTSAQSAALLGVPQLATGTNYVPQDMFAFLHKGESVVPAQYNPSSGADPMLRMLMEKLSAELEGLKDAQRVANSHAFRTAEAVNGRPESPMLVEAVS